MTICTHPSTNRLLRGILVAGLALPAMAQGTTQIKTDNSSIKFGFLFQPQYEAIGAPVKDGTIQNLFLRRARFLVGGTLGSDFEYFFETDTANLGKTNTAGTNATGNTSTMVVQDAVITWKARDEFKIDAGLILIPFAHNSNQSAASLLSWDYFSYSFSQNAAFGTNVGRDTGVQFRGLIAKKFEYRLGAFQGKRIAESAATTADPNGLTQSRNAMRIAGRLQYNFFDAETGMFYAGSYAGAKKILSIGLGYDKQDEYTGSAYDIFFDWPLANKDVLTFQLNQVNYDGKTWLTSLTKQSGLSAEAGYRFSALKFSPILRYEKKTFDVHTATNLDETRIGGGLAFWLKGNNANVKIFYNNIKPENVVVGTALTKQHSYDQINVQFQYFIF